MRHLAPIVLVTFLIALAATPAGARPRPPAPPSNAAGPPPAWVETRGGDRWLAFSTYCWTTVCADYIPPWDRDDLPGIALRRGEVVRFHLRYQPRRVTLRFFSAGGANSTHAFRLAPGRVVEWRVRGRGGIALLETFASKGDAGFVARLRIR